MNPVQVDPAAELKSLIMVNGQGGWAVEVTDQYIKTITAFGIPRIIPFSQIADIHIIFKGDVYQVSAWDPNRREIYTFRPRMHDLATCQHFLDTFYALTRRPIPGGMPANGTPAQPAPPPGG